MARLIHHDGTDYLDLVGRIHGRNVSFEAWLKGCQDYRALCLRHDVDTDLENAVAMAEVEAAHGLSATYFLLHTASYFKVTPMFRESCQRIVGLGHQIGIHIDPLWAVVQEGLAPAVGRDWVWIALNILREYCGVRVVGSACHGYPKCYDAGFLNYQLWTEFDPLVNEGLVNDDLAMPQVSLAEWGLEYEVYFLDYAAYLNECGSGWTGVLLAPGQYKPFERGLRQCGLNAGQKIIPRFNDLQRGMFHLLTHTNRDKWEVQ